MVNELLAQEMKIILTHEQADFDAVASMLAARILNPEALPILPRRLNRNVRAYLTLYGDGLPFIEFGDIKPSPLADVILVDTQSLISVKGFSEETNVHVVDHHPRLEMDDSYRRNRCSNHSSCRGYPGIRIGIRSGFSDDALARHL
jgi:tRNA nucleotidyltransferase (CCA-adding enzyme)